MRGGEYLGGTATKSVVWTASSATLSGIPETEKKPETCKISPCWSQVKTYGAMLGNAYTSYALPNSELQLHARSF